MIFDDKECYELFIAVDDRVRQLSKPSTALLALRERLMPVYEARHNHDLDAKSMLGPPIDADQ